jgi:eukaryotic-like serine/threonine-protein kinase
MSERSTTGDGSAPAKAGPPDVPAIPGYEVREELGRGGMGVVYKALQVSSGRLVALKLIRDIALAGPQEHARFRIETQAAARMRHPNIVQVHEVGDHDGRPFFAMELVEGGSLDTLLAGRPQPALESASLIRTLALAMQHAHAQNVIHRDLKPANILLGRKSEIRNPKSETNSEDKTENADQQTEPVLAIGDLGFVSDFGFRISDFEPKITDFGLAKRLDTDSTAWTQDGAVLGTAGYMAPEQAAGRAREVGPAADVYALGAILYECLTGRPPFQADSWAQMLAQVLNDELMPPTRRQPNVPRELETVCLHCLEKAPDRRYADAGALADDLGRFLERKPVAAIPLSARERLTRLAARDGYRIVGEIGPGPRSIVYHALHGSLGQPVAVKVFAPGMCTREAWDAQLQRGAEARAALAHPQVVPVQQAGWWDDAPFLVLEYVPHGSLAARIAGKPQATGQALRLVEQLAGIVSYLHRQGVVHGNLKPSNVLLAADGIPRVTDLLPMSGLFQGSRSPAAVTDAAGVGYLAPEVIRTGGAEPRFYTDIYGLGLILYELLTGRPPFDAATAQAALEQVRSQDPVPPSQRNSAIAPPLDAFCLRCLHKNPWRRYTRAYDAEMLLGRYRRQLDGVKSADRPPGPQPPRRANRARD